MEVVGWGEAAGAVRGRIDRAAARAALSSAHGAGNAQPAVAKAMALHRHSKLRRPHRSRSATHEGMATHIREGETTAAATGSARAGRLCPLPAAVHRHHRAFCAWRGLLHHKADTEHGPAKRGLCFYFPHFHMGLEGTRDLPVPSASCGQRGRRDARRHSQERQRQPASGWGAGGREGGGKIPGEAKINRANAGRSRAHWLT